MQDILFLLLLAVAGAVLAIKRGKELLTSVYT